MKKAIALQITDTHLSINNIDLVISIFKQAVDICKKENIKILIHLGDWFNNRQGQPDYLLVIHQEIIRLFEEAKIIILTKAGNHDRTDLDSWYSYITVFNSDYFKVVDGHDGRYRVMLQKGIYGHFLPFFKSDKYLEQLAILKKDIVKGEKNICFTHIGVNGVKNNDGSKVEGRITQDLFKEFDATFIGHYHDSSELPNSIKYIGSAYQANYGERIDDKGFHLLYNDCSTKFIPSKFPKFIKIKINASDKTEIQNALELYSDKKYENDNIRFLFFGKQTDIDKIKNDLSKFTEAGIEVKTETEEQEENMNKIINDEFIEFNSKTIKKEFIQYCVNNKIPSDKRKFMLDILNDTL